MRKLTIAAMLMLAAVYCGAQDFSSILSEIERNNITLKSSNRSWRESILRLPYRLLLEKENIGRTVYGCGNRVCHR